MQASGSHENLIEPGAGPDADCRLGGSGNLIVLSGPSGVGKDTVVCRLLQNVPNLSRCVTVTTRAKRAGEEDGVDYLFRSRQEFAELRQNNQLIESAEFAGSMYGTPRGWVEQELKQGRDVLLVIDVQGAKQVRERMPASVLIFLSPPSFQELESRLRGRGTETAEKIAVRLEQARQEIGQKQMFHYEVVNDNVDKAVNNLAHIIYAERSRIRQSAK